jgi:hypothetical protein
MDPADREASKLRDRGAVAVGNSGGRIRPRHFRPRRSGRAVKFAGRVAGDSIASHADFANIDALTQLLWIEVYVLPDYANTLFVGVLDLL